MSKSRPLGEYDVRLAEMLTTMQAHIEADAKAFEQLIGELREVNADLKTVNTDVKTLIQTRSFAFGAWKAATVIGGIIVVLAGLILTYLKH